MARVFVTGASTGVGLGTSSELIGWGHEVVMHGRKPGRFDGIKGIGGASGFIYGDLSTLEETRHVADSANQYGPFDAVIHNARTMNGNLLNTNVAAPYLLSALMLRPGRTIVLSSSMHQGGYVNLDHLARISYSDSKLLVTVLAMPLSRKWQGVLSHAVDPGWVPTRMGGAGAPDDLIAGHQTQTWLATAGQHEIKPSTGGYWYHKRASRPHPSTLDPAFQDKLIRKLEGYAGVAFPLP